MRKEWYIFVNKVQEGPYSILQLKRDSRITPDTLVWKKGLEKWTPASKVPELKELFEDDEDESDDEEELFPQRKGYDEQLALSMQKDPFQIFFWLIVAAIVFAYVLYQFNFGS